MEEPNRQEQFSGTKEVDPKHRLEEKALFAYMQKHVEGFQG